MSDGVQRKRKREVADRVGVELARILYSNSKYLTNGSKETISQTLLSRA